MRRAAGAVIRGSDERTVGTLRDVAAEPWHEGASWIAATPRCPARDRVRRTYRPCFECSVKTSFTPSGSEFSVVDLGGNDGGGTTGPWLAPWELPNTITCDDRPPVIPPPPPASW